MAPWGDLDERLLGCFVREVDYAELQTNGPGDRHRQVGEGPPTAPGNRSYSALALWLVFEAAEAFTFLFDCRT